MAESLYRGKLEPGEVWLPGRSRSAQQEGLEQLEKLLLEGVKQEKAAQGCCKTPRTGLCGSGSGL